MNEDIQSGFLIQIQWSEIEKETIAIEPNLCKGDVLHTTDSVQGNPSYFDYYEAHVEELSCEGTEHTLILNYTKEDNVELFENYGSKCCGRSTIIWDSAQLGAIKNPMFKPFNGEKIEALNAKIIIPTNQIELEYMQVFRLKRNQSRFKMSLLKKHQHVK